MLNDLGTLLLSTGCPPDKAIKLYLDGNEAAIVSKLSIINGCEVVVAVQSPEMGKCLATIEFHNVRKSGVMEELGFAASSGEPLICLVRYNSKFIAPSGESVIPLVWLGKRLNVELTDQDRQRLEAAHQKRARKLSAGKGVR